MLNDSQAQKWSELRLAARHQISYTWFNRRSWSASAFPSARWSACSSEEYNPGLGPVRLGYCPTILWAQGFDRTATLTNACTARRSLQLSLWPSRKWLRRNRHINCFTFCKMLRLTWKRRLGTPVYRWDSFETHEKRIRGFMWESSNGTHCDFTTASEALNVAVQLIKRRPRDVQRA